MNDCGLILACVPKNKEKQRLCKVFPAKGTSYSSTKCWMCDCEILISENQKKIYNKGGYKRWCASCVFKLADTLGDKCECVNIKDFH